MTKNRIALDRLREMLDYAPATGLFTRKVRAGRHKSGTVAGYIDKVNGYIRIEIDGVLYHGHRLAWFHMTGEWPQYIDHRNANGADNRWSNIRNVTQVVNMQNRKRAASHNKLGVLGVTAHGRGYAASIKSCGKTLYLGTHDTIELAHSAYLTAKRKLHEGCTI